MENIDFNFVRSIREYTSDLCQPLLKQFGIDFFGFIRCYDNGEQLLLTTSPHVYEFLYAHKYKFIINIENKLIKDEFSYLVPMNGYYLEALKHLNLWYPMDIFQRYLSYYEFFCCASFKSDSNLVYYYLNEQESIKEIYTNFKVQAAALINKSEQFKFVLPESMRSNMRGLSSNCNKKSYRFYLDNKVKLSYITPKEATCSYLMIQGKSAREIADIMQVSPRTVETHIINMKNRLNCHKKSELISLILNNRIFKEIKTFYLNKHSDNRFASIG